MPRNHDLNHFLTWFLPKLNQEAYVCNADTLQILNASAGARQGVKQALAAGANCRFSNLLNEARLRELKDFLGTGGAGIGIADQAAAGSNASADGFDYQLLQGPSGPLLVALAQSAPAALPTGGTRSEMHYQAIVSNVPGLIYLLQLDDEDRISFVYLSEGCERLLEFTPELLQSKPALFIEKLIPEDRGTFLDELFRSRQHMTPFNWEGRIWSEEFRDIKWINLRSSPRKVTDQLTQWDGMMNNITQSKREKLQIEESNRLLTELSQEMEKIKERERLRIAREIHDDLGGNLTAIRIGMGSLFKQIDRSQPGNVEKISHLESVIDQTFEAVHRIASDLRPDVLELGIVEGLSWLAREFEKGIGIPCHLKVVRPQPLTTDQDITLFRICQEAMSNIAKHARASEVNIELVFEPGEVTMTISDNGIGLSPQDLRKPNALGLKGMSERLAELSGHFEIRPGKEKGTMKIFKLPIG